MQYYSFIGTVAILLSTTQAQNGLFCPLSGAECTDGKTSHIAYSENAPACWSRTYYGWLCKPKVEGKECNAADHWVDTTKCTIPPTPACPSSKDQCKYEGKIVTPLSENAPRCWAKNTDDTWTCQQAILGGSCGNNNYANIRECKFQ